MLGMALPPLLGGPFAAAFSSLFAGVAARHNCAFVPFLLDGVAGNPNLNLPDMIHPNANGQKILAGNVWPVLKRALQ